MDKLESSNEFHYLKVPSCDNEKEKEAIDIPLKYGYGVRHVQLIIFTLCMAMSFIARGHLGVTIVAMTSHQNSNEVKHFGKENISNLNSTYNLPVGHVNFTLYSEDQNHTTLENQAYIINSSNNGGEAWTIYKTYDWPKSIQEMVLTSFFLGYCLTTFPIALVCQRWGGKVPLQIAMLVNGISSILTPWLVSWGNWKAICFCRILQGLSQAGTYPGIQTLLAQWVPHSERASLSGYVYTGVTVGNIIGFQLSGVIADAWGWPAVFWMVGAMSLITFTLLTIFGAASPMCHKKISIEEKNYIMGHCDSGVMKKRGTPWKAIVTSKPVWGIFATHVGSGLTSNFFLTQVPSYIHYTLGINVKSSGIFTSVPYFGSLFTSLLTGIVSDYLTNRKIVSIKNARRLFNTSSQVGMALSLICASYANSTLVVVTCFTICLSFHMGIHSGWMVNHIDIAPNYSGTLMALGNVFMNICILIMPFLVSNIVIDMTNVYQWRIMLFLVAGMAFFLNVIFVIFMSVDVQPWNEGHPVEGEPSNDLNLESIKKKQRNSVSLNNKVEKI